MSDAHTRRERPAGGAHTRRERPAGGALAKPFLEQHPHATAPCSTTADLTLVDEAMVRIESIATVLAGGAFDGGLGAETCAALLAIVDRVQRIACAAFGLAIVAAVLEVTT